MFVPRRHGIYMPVGDTVGPGGTSRALRMIPAMVAVAQDILDLCPQALFFNYGNPMAAVCRAVRKATGAEVIGLCHGVPHTARILAEALGTDPSRLSYKGSGINHLTWLYDFQVDGEDVSQQLLQVAAQRTQDVENCPPGADPYTSPSDNAFSWQLYARFGAFPAPMDRHVTEFFPQFFREGAYFGHSLGVDIFSFEGTIADGDRGYARMEADALNPEPLKASYFDQFSGEHEQVLDIIRAIRQGSEEVFFANLPNHGREPDLPWEAVLEAPAATTAAGLQPLPQPALPAGIAGTLASRFLWVETTVEAALERSREKFIQALVLDGAVHSMGQAATLADDLLEAQADYLDW